MDTKTIVVIEDEDLLLQAIDIKLKARGYETVPCKTAEEALTYLKNNEKKLPDLIWLDYYLPGMDGNQFMNEILKNQSWAQIPVIVVSNSASDQKKNTMLSLGVQAYILKAQYRLDDIVSLMENVMRDTKAEPQNAPTS
jgi:two-component system phosphate regulon response regulator PhoB